MTRLRHVPGPALDFETGDHRDAPACVGHSHVYDLIISALNKTPHPRWRTMDYRYALASAATLCGGCPVRDWCDTEYAAEPWKKAVKTRRRAETRPR